MQEWYLMQSPTMIGGDEDSNFLDFKDDAFNEVLGTDFAIDVEICNYDLSEIKQTRAIINQKTKDTELQTLTRQMLVPVGTCKAGMYVKYKGRYWLIVGLVDDTMLYEKAILSLCNWLLTWVNHNNQIVQRWANVVSASQYNNGETGMQYYFVRSDQVLLALPDDDESLLIPDKCRVVIDKRCQAYEKRFDDNTLQETSNPLITYQLTRLDTVLYNYGDSGHLEFIVSQDEKQENDGYYVIDGKGYWLCGSPTKNTNAHSSSSAINGPEIIYNGMESGMFAAEFLDANGNSVHVTPVWTISCDFLDKLCVDEMDNLIYVSVNDSSLIGKSFNLSLDGDGYGTVTLTVTIGAFL